MRPFSAQRVVIVSLLCMIPLVMILISLPIFLTLRLSFIDLFFTATSLCTITGLMVVPIGSFNLLGQAILLCFMQIGGIGLITLSIYFMSFFMKLSIGTQVFSARLLNINSWAGIKQFIFFIIKITLFIQSIGTLLLFFYSIQYLTIGHALFVAYFHAVSAFTSAGLVIFPEFFSSKGCMIVLIALMICGEIGFIVWYEIVEYLCSFFTKKRVNISLHTKIVIHSTLIITISSLIAYCFLERCLSLIDLNFYEGVSIALFNSVAARGTGFFIGSLTSLCIPTLIIIMILTFIGASPGSTGSGIKTTSLSLLFAFVRSTLHDRPHTTLRGRTITASQINQAISLIILSVLWIFVAFFILLVTENATSITILFEVVSAFGNCGLSLGLTSELSVIGKIVIACTMIVGRLGCLSIMLAFISSKKSLEYSYPIERVMIN